SAGHRSFKGACATVATQYMKLQASEAASIAQWLSSPDNLPHGRPISIAEAQQRGLRVSFLEADQDLQNLALALFHSAVITFETTNCIKFVENHRGIGAYYFQPKVVPQIPQVTPPNPR